MEKIKEFIYPENKHLSGFENLKLKNRSSHNNYLHQSVFTAIDEFSKRVMKDMQNLVSVDLIESNSLMIMSDNKKIEDSIAATLRAKGHKVTTLENPEMLYRAYNFHKPDNLLPHFNQKLYLIKQRGLNENGISKEYFINPYFFGFKICFDIFINSLFAKREDPNLEKGLLKILSDKYGEEYKMMYNYVSDITHRYMMEGAEKGDEKDETLKAGVIKISGINSDKIFHNFIYHTAMLTSHNNVKVIKQVNQG